jgi:tetratricopeptide (TPR) repeat protein
MDFYKYSDMQVIYGFEKQGKVALSLAAVMMQPPRRTLDMDGNWKTETYAPTVERMIVPNGKYSQNGNSIRIEFSDHVINATLTGNRMEGEAVRKQSGKKAKWVADKIPNAGTNVDSRANGKDLLTKADELKKQGKYLDAVENYTAAIGLNLGVADKLLAHSNRGDAKLQLKDYRGAIADYSQFIELMSGEGEDITGFESRPNISDDLELIVFNNRGVAKDRFGDKVGACKDFSTSCALAELSEQRTKIGCENFKRLCN